MHFVLALCAYLVSTGALAADAPQHFATASGLHFFSGDHVRVTETDADSIFVAGGVVEVQKAAAEHIFGVGRTLRLLDTTIEDAFLAGREVEIDSAIADDIFAAGERVEIRPTAKIGGDGLYAGDIVRVAGASEGDVIAAGRRIELSGTVGGNVTLAASEIVLTPGLKIAGTFSYRSPEAVQVPDGVVIGGPTRREVWPEEVDSQDSRSPLVSGIAGALAMMAALGLFAAALLAGAPRVADMAVARIKGSPWLSIGVGVAALIGLPILAVLVCLTVIGIPLGLFVFAVGAISFGAAAVVGWTWLGTQLLSATRAKLTPTTFATRSLGALAGLAVFVILGFIPVVGLIVQIALVLLGYGAFVLAVAPTKSGHPEAA